MNTELKSDTSHYDKCRTLMLRHKQHHTVRLALLVCLALAGMFANVTLPINYNLAYLYGFAFGLTAIVYYIGIVVSALLAVPEKPKLVILTCALIVLGIIIRFVTPVFGIPMLIVCLTEIPDCRQAVWVKNQPGYPHFSERFDEQMERFGKEYQSDHQFDNQREAEMPEMPDVPSPDFEEKSASEMPEIPDISEN